MRINKIFIRNIHSLKGEHTIDFDVLPLKGSGIFAITGPTGAGKSSILDAITLALYSRVPRIGKVTDSAVQNLGSLVTHFTREAAVEIRYTIRDEVYLSTWSIGQTSGLKWKPVQMEVSKLIDGEFEMITNKLSEVPTVNEQLIGLSYDQFTKSILLSQGEFSQFLKASSQDRSELLEKITGSYIYRELGKAAFERKKQGDENIQRLQAKLEGVRILTDEEFVEAEKQISELETRVKQNGLKLAKLESDRDKYRHLEKAKASEIQFQKDEADLDLKISGFSDKRSKMERHVKVAPMAKALQSFQETQKRILVAEEARARYASEIGQIDLNTNQELEDLRSWIHPGISISDYQSEIRIFESAIKQVQFKKQTLVESGRSLRKKLVAKAESITDKQFLQLVENESPQMILRAIEEQLISIGKLGADSIDKLNESYDICLLELQQKEERHRKLQNQMVLLKESDRLKSEVAAKDIALVSLKEQIEQLEGGLREALEALEKKHKEHDEAFKLTNIEKFTDMLRIGEPCPLCKQIVSEDHGHAPVSDLLRLGMELNDLKKASNTQQEKVNLVHKEEAGLMGSKKALMDALSKINLDPALPFQTVELEKSVSDTELKLTQLQSRKKAIQEQIKTAGEIQVFNELAAIGGELLTTTNDYIETQATLKNLCPMAKGKPEAEILTTIAQFEQRLSSAVVKKAALVGTLQNVMQSLDTDQLWVKENLPQLKANLKKEGVPDLSVATEYLLSFEAYNQLVQEWDTLKKEKAFIANKLSEAREQIAELTKSGLPEATLPELETAIQELVKINDSSLRELGAYQQKIKVHLEELQSKAQIIKEIESATESHRPWILLNAQIGDATGSKFSKFAQHLTLLQLTEKANDRLRALSDRYLIQNPAPDEDMAIIDLYQGNTIRSVKTLSGGETFLISLSFALGLSDLASANHSLESLFIDEGISTLDIDSLEMAIETLERLQTDNNKTIGIISHIESLKERISTQIRLIRKGSGYSKIEVVSI